MNSTLTTDQPSFTESVYNIIVEMTDNGRTIVEFLISAVNGEFPDFQPCHKLEAARLLEKYSGADVKALIDNPDLPQPTRRERRDSRRADRRIRTELAQIVKEETDNGRTIVTFLVKAMEGELEDFRACHRMSACKELLHQGSQYELERQATEEEAEPVEGPEEREERLRREEYERRRAEAIEFSLHGPVYYEVYPDAWCPCEGRRRDCEGNELSDEERTEVEALAPGYNHFIHDLDKQEAYKKRYKAYLERLNPGVDIDINAFRWRNLTRDP